MKKTQRTIKLAVRGEIIKALSATHLQHVAGGDSGPADTCAVVKHLQLPPDATTH
jgi:hypothetical protein